MDRVLYLIKDELPKEVVKVIYQPLSQLKNVRSISDMVAFVLIVSGTKKHDSACNYLLLFAGV